jgi:hypothetical protein
MKEDFSPEKSHDENVKVAIDKILGQPTNLKRKKKSAEDHKRVLFCKIIDRIIMAEERAIGLDEAFGLNLEEYNQVFFDVIQDLLSYSFNREQMNLLNFYMYDRYCADGTVLDLVDEDGNHVPLDTATDLWFVIKNAE